MTLGGHRDTPYNLNALPAVDSMMIQNLAGQSIRQAGLIRGIRNSAVSFICLPKVSSITVFLLGHGNVEQSVATQLMCSNCHVQI